MSEAAPVTHTHMAQATGHRHTQGTGHTQGTHRAQGTHRVQGKAQDETHSLEKMMSVSAYIPLLLSAPSIVFTTARHIGLLALRYTHVLNAMARTDIYEPYM
jgi:hypothetical protein